MLPGQMQHGRGRRGSGKRRLRELTRAIVDTMEILEEVRERHADVGGASKAFVQVHSTTRHHVYSTACTCCTSAAYISRFTIDTHVIYEMRGNIWGWTFKGATYRLQLQKQLLLKVTLRHKSWKYTPPVWASHCVDCYVNNSAQVLLRFVVLFSSSTCRFGDELAEI